MLVELSKLLGFSTCTNPIIHLFYPPKICIGIVLDYSWDRFMSQEKLQTMSMQNFGGRGVKQVHYGIVQIVNWLLLWIEKHRMLHQNGTQRNQKLFTIKVLKSKIYTLQFLISLIRPSFSTNYSMHEMDTSPYKMLLSKQTISKITCKWLPE